MIFYYYDSTCYSLFQSFGACVSVPWPLKSLCLIFPFDCFGLLILFFLLQFASSQEFTISVICQIIQVFPSHPFGEFYADGERSVIHTRVIRLLVYSFTRSHLRHIQFKWKTVKSQIANFKMN